MDSKVYKCKIKTLSPVHIGSGKKYRPSEYINSKAKLKGEVFNTIKRIDFANFYMSLEGNKQERFLANLSNPNYKLEQDYPKISKEFTRYTAINKSSISKENNIAPEISEHIKTSDNVYIPGSSIKGAIKTAIFYDILSDEDIDEIYDLIQNRGNKNVVPKGSYNRFIDSFFSAPRGNSAQKNILRFLQISDSTIYNLPTIHEIISIMAESSGGMPRGVRNYSRNGAVVRTYLETIDENKILQSDFTINNDLEVLSELDLMDKSFILDIDYIKKAIYNFSNDLIQHELEFADKYDVDDLTKFYNSLSKYNKEESPVLRIGAGSGFMATTIALKIKDYDSREGTNIYEEVRKTAHRSYGYEFPKSRKVTKTGLPLSWVQLNFEEK